jgi:hypothetical protein
MHDLFYWGIIDSAKPDIILGTETWLDKDTSSYEFFPSELFNIYRSDRKPNKNNQSYGGVLIACGIDQSMWPRLKFPPKIILVLDAWFILLRDNSSCCRDVPLSDGGL